MRYSEAPVLKARIAALSVYGPAFQNMEQLRQLMKGSRLPLQVPDAAVEMMDDNSIQQNVIQQSVASQKSVFVKPKPAIIPPNERRRAPLPVCLAVETSLAACQKIGVTPKELPCVFASGLGDTQLTEYMCQTLASENKALSPTKFHNSVHNAPVGYWSISTDATCAANAVAGFEETVSLALLEALVQCQVEKTPVLMTVYDTPAPQALLPMLHNKQGFSASIILLPEAKAEQEALAILGPDLYQTVAGSLEVRLTAQVLPEPCQWPDVSFLNPELELLYQTNPAARILSLVHALLSQSGAETIVIPMSHGTSLKLTLEGAL